MASKNDKTLSESLFAFNNHIVSMKDVFKKSKINQISKLVRKIKQYKTKKGNETQLEKNKRKCEHLKNEINLIKKLKFNDIAIFSFDNDGLTFDQYIKNNIKDLNSEKIALARVSLCKQVVQAIEKIKNDSKINGWKNVFIQYKARCEKRRNWKEKNRLLKEIESKLKDENKSAELNEAESDKEEETSSLKRKVKFSDDESGPESEEEEIGLEESDLKDGYDSHDDDKWNNEANSVLTETESEAESESESELESDSEAVDDEPEEAYVYSKSNLETKKEVEIKKENLKPLVILNKPSHMEIKQLNLEELTNKDEIPIENKLETEKDLVETIKAVKDPFFLDQDGNEIQDLEENKNRFKQFRNDDYFEMNEPRSYSSYDRYRKDKNDFRNRRENLTNSSFKNSLSKDRPFNRDFKNDNRNFRYTERNASFNRRQPEPKKEDLTKLHPSWQAKKLLEEKVKTLKFEGKKTKFDDE